MIDLNKLDVSFTARWALCVIYFAGGAVCQRNRFDQSALIKISGMSKDLFSAAISELKSAGLLIVSSSSVSISPQVIRQETACGSVSTSPAQEAHNITETTPLATEESLSASSIEKDLPAQVCLFPTIVESGKGNPKSSGVSTQGSRKVYPKNRVNESRIIQVFNFWKEHIGGPRSYITPKRRKKIAESLAMGYSVEDRCLAMKGCVSSPWHMGENDRSIPYNDLEFILRSGEKIEWFMQIATLRQTDKEVDQASAKYKESSSHYEKGGELRLAMLKKKRKLPSVRVVDATEGGDFEEI